MCGKKKIKRNRARTETRLLLPSDKQMWCKRWKSPSLTVERCKPTISGRMTQWEVEEVHVGGKVKRGRCWERFGPGTLFITEAPDASAVPRNTVARCCRTDVRIKENRRLLGLNFVFVRQQMVETVRKYWWMEVALKHRKLSPQERTDRKKSQLPLWESIDFQNHPCPWLYWINQLSITPCSILSRGGDKKVAVALGGRHTKVMWFCKSRVYF